MGVRALHSRWTYTFTLQSLAPIALLLLAAVLFVPGILFGPPRDADVFALIGERLLAGDLPYRDIWDHKPPGIYFVTAAAAVMPGPTWPWLWGGSIAVTTATAWVIARYAGFAVAAIAVIVLALFPISGGGGMTETFAVLPASFALLFAMERRAPFATGVLTALALSLSLLFLPLIAAAALLAQKRAGTLALGFGMSAATIVALLGLAGVLPDAWDALVRYNAAYGRLPRDWDDLNLTLLALVPLIAFARPNRSRVTVAALAWVCIGVALIAVGGRSFPHYAIAFVPPLAAVAARPSLPRIGVSVVAIILLAYVSAATTNWNPNRHLGPVSADVGMWVAEHSDRNDRILVWGFSAAGVYSASERAPAGRYPYALPLSTPGYSSTAQVAAWLAQLKAQPPAVIVDFEAANAGADQIMPLPRPGTAQGRNLDLIGPVRLWVSQSYVFAAELHGVRLYVMRADVPGGAGRPRAPLSWS